MTMLDSVAFGALALLLFFIAATVVVVGATLILTLVGV